MNVFKLTVLALLCGFTLSANAKIKVKKPKKNVAVQTGQYEPSWENLAAWECPEWFRNAKFGIWAHWDPQCQAEAGDWYAREMYYPGWKQDWHKSHFGNPKDYGYKELCRDWKAQDWDPEALIKLYKSAGARYFMAMGNHHDNFDCWDSPYQEWNSMNVGPMRDIVGGWAEMCEKYGLKLGISFHASHTWTWMEPSTWYDGTLTKDDGKGLWWEGLDPQELYAQNHPHSSGWESSGSIHGQWAWSNGAALPSQAYKQKFLNRVLQAINKYHPAVIYFDDTVLPFWGCDESVGLNILTHYYNTSAREDGTGKAEVVVTGKILQDQHKRAMLWDVERGIPDRCQDLPWQTCTCIGDWHYERGTYDRNGYKSADQVIRMLVDIVSKNGNLLLSIPVRGSGVIDERERERVNGIKAWMDINSESIYDTRPWKVYGEGPLFDSANPLNAQGFNEGINYSNTDVRYVQKDGKVYATIMQWPAAGPFTFKAFSITAASYSGRPTRVRLLGGGDVPFSFDANGLTVQVSSTRPNGIAPVFEVNFEEAGADTESLQLLIDVIGSQLDAYTSAAGFNTGQYNTYAISKLQAVLHDAQEVAASADTQAASRTLQTLRTAYNHFLQNGVNAGGALGTTGTDLTTAKLVEASNFSSMDASTSRFGTPKNWTVENFNVPQTNGNSPKNGIDKYSGQAALMLGLWAGEDGNTTSDLRNARIYRRVTLEPGRYFFGASYNTIYNMSAGYIFAATATVTTDLLPEQALAYYPLSKCTNDGQFYGIEFTIAEEQEVLLGWQADLKRGATQLEFRADKVKLVRRKDNTLTSLQTLVKKANTALAKAEGRTGVNTGCYDADAVALLTACVAGAALADGASQADLDNAYYTLQAAYDDFVANGIIAHTVYNLGSGLPDDSRDLTVEKLAEADNFARTDASTTRFGKPMHWTVENFQIPNGADGTKNGLDRYSGQDALMLGIWNDRSSNQSGSLANARIYRKIHLDAGRYYFGARYNANYQLNKAYIFASNTLLTTAKIPTDAIAYDDISTCGMDGLYYGICFTLPEAQDLYLGFQANLASGSGTQEFRAEAVRLLALNVSETVGIDAIDGRGWPSPDRPSAVSGASASGVYDLSGRRVTTPYPSKKGMYIKQGRKVLL
ncbi:MAG: alpha-L-fucosidase [Bacteroidaceae bacterium]|nr:alpha-L-fucosidase [Bacteroidaceae bacterium]